MNFCEICRSRTSLREEDVEILRGLEPSLQLIANLTAADVFIDCMDMTGKSAVVVAQARPEYGRESLYKSSVVGMPVLRENEPAVFHALESGSPVRDLKAITQENVSVKQDVVPVMSADGDRVVGVLIRERDVSESLLYEKKFHELARRHEGSRDLAFAAGDEDDFHKAAIREMHHRVKNSLQLVASIMNLQAKGAGDPDVRRAFEESGARVLSIAATHDIISLGGNIGSVPLGALLSSVARGIETIAHAAKRVEIVVEGGSAEVGSDVASSVALVVNELVSNAVRHGYDEGGRGRVAVSVYDGLLQTTIWVEDDGRGFDPETARRGLGLRLVSLTVRDKLRGDLQISSSDSGTKASFSFKNKIL